MNLFNRFRRRRTAPVARERLQILLSHERSAQGHSDLVGILREEILAALRKHITVDQENVVIRMDRGAKVSTLEIEVAVPHSMARMDGGIAA
ncbi:MAG TPA: cell division topological specificity factor MinE [Xanthobacteraceae bacterium]|jgi:cell division topological specificity factor